MSKKTTTAKKRVTMTEAEREWQAKEEVFARLRDRGLDIDALVEDAMGQVDAALAQTLEDVYRVSEDDYAVVARHVLSLAEPA